MHSISVPCLRVAAAVCAALSAAACSPALDWRETRIEGVALMALFPCRPVGQSRPLVLADTPVEMSLRACEAAGATYAVSAADMRDPARVGPALQALHDSSVNKVGGASSAASGAWAVPGMTPQAAAGRWRLTGPTVDGVPHVMETAVFAHGTWVVQASVIGASSVAAAPFFDGLRIEP